MDKHIIRLVPENARWDVRNPPPAEWISKTPTDWATWGTQLGTVEFVYDTGEKYARLFIFERYNPQQMPTMAHILGAIYYFYNTPMTKEDAKEVFDNSPPESAGYDLTEAFFCKIGDLQLSILI